MFGDRPKRSRGGSADRSTLLSTAAPNFFQLKRLNACPVFTASSGHPQTNLSHLRIHLTHGRPSARGWKFTGTSVMSRFARNEDKRLFEGASDRLNAGCFSSLYMLNMSIYSCSGRSPCRFCKNSGREPCDQPPDRPLRIPSRL